MKDTDLIAALRKRQVDGCVDFDCEANCAINGCRLHGLAADRIAEYDSALENIKAVYKRASGSEKYLLQDVIALFDPAYGNPSNLRNHIAKQHSNVHLDISCSPIPTIPPLYPFRKRITDFERCADDKELAATLRCIDERGYYMSGVTQDASGEYTVFFRRPAL